MKICMLTYRGNPYCGGQGVYISYLSAELSRQGHEVHCISGPPYPNETGGMILHRVEGLQLYDGNGGYPPRENPLTALEPLNIYEKAAFQAGIFPEMTTFSFRAYKMVRKLLTSHKFDIIHDNQTLGWGLLPMKWLGVPMVATIHHPLTIDRLRGFEPPASFADQLRKMLFYPLIMQGMVARRMPHIVTVSRAAALEIENDFRIRREKISIVYNGVDTEIFRPIPKIKKAPGRVLFVGNIQDPNKGGIYLLRAMALLKKPAHLVVVTGGLAEPDRFERELKEFGLTDKVKVYFKLNGEELVQMFASAEVAVSPSIFEGFGFPAAEAMACGLPLIAAEGGSLPEVVGDAGLLVPVRDGEALAQAIKTLLEDGEKRKKLGKAARERILERFQWKIAAAEMAEVYRNVIDAHG